MLEFPRLWSEFGRDRRGTFAVAGAVAAPVLAIAIGYSVNLAQIAHTRSNLQNALDAAVTSTARDLTTGKIKEQDARASVEAFLLSNARTTLAKDDTVALDNLVVNRVDKTVAADASVQANMFFPMFGAGNRRRVEVDSAALYSDKKVEVTMMLDITGSMAGRKIADLKAAAANAVDGLLDGVDPAEPRVRMAIVPYAEAVNVGGFAKNTVFPELSPALVPSGYDANLPPPLVSAVSAMLNALVAAQRPDNCATERKLVGGAADPSDDAPDSLRLDGAGRKYLALVNRDDRLSKSSCPAPSIVPLTADAAALKAAINKFSANGYTSGGIALQWGYYMLSPSWRDAIRNAGLGDGPAAYDNKKTTKVAILMTDGEFNTAFTGGNLASSSGLHDKGDEAQANAAKLCDAMKADGIQIFTVGFALSAKESNAARKSLKACASPDAGPVKHFYDVASGGELDDAFQEIIANAERLAVTR